MVIEKNYTIIQKQQKVKKTVEGYEEWGIHKTISKCTKSKYFHDKTVEKSNYVYTTPNEP